MPEIRIGITGWGSISPLGTEREEILEAYRRPHSLLHTSAGGAFVGALPSQAEERITALRESDRRYSGLDRSVLLALLAARRACRMAGWNGERAFGINLGSSRGATGLLEQFHRQYLEGGREKLPPATSPTTTLGNIASWVAQDLGAEGPALSHSITCSTALHALLNGITWLESGRSDRFLIGGSEAPLTGFTVAQMQALRIYAREESPDNPFPCRAGDLQKPANGMVLGEGAACFCLERAPVRPIAWVDGIGYGAEKINSPTGLSRRGLCLQRSMRGALEEAGIGAVDVIVSHTPGTLLGDHAEMQAIEMVFGQDSPAVTNNKWKIGHTLGASGALSMEMALLMLLYGQLIEVPYLPAVEPIRPVRRVMVNAVGFGGNAVSVILSAPSKEGTSAA